MTKTIEKTYNILNDNVRIINYMVLICCFALAFVYAINIFSLISKTVALQKVEASIANLASGINELDSRYLSLSGDITPDNLVAYGMIRSQVSEYIPRKSESKLSLGEEFNHVALTNER